LHAAPQSARNILTNLCPNPARNLAQPEKSRPDLHLWLEGLFKRYMQHQIVHKEQTLILQHPIECDCSFSS